MIRRFWKRGRRGGGRARDGERRLGGLARRLSIRL